MNGDIGTMSKEELLKRGYTEFGGTDTCNVRTRMFQKRFDDRKGKKYFITVTYSVFNINGKSFENFECETQFNNDVGTKNIIWLSVEDIDKVEKEADFIWNILKGEHYEVF